MTVHGREVLDSPFTNACAHNFQMMTFLLGDSLRAACGVTGLEAELYRGNPQVENFDIAALRFATDCGAELMYFTAHPIAPDVLGPRGVFEFGEGTITFDSEGPSFRARMKDGRQVDYTGIAPGIPCKSCWTPSRPCGRAARRVRRGGGPGAHPRGAPGAGLPRGQRAGGAVRPYTQEGQRFLRVEGIEQLFSDCLDAWALPGELGRRLD